MNHLRMKNTALLLVVLYLLLGFSTVAVGLCPTQTTVSPAEPVLAAECCGQNAMPAPANAVPCGACLDKCEPAGHSVHLGSSPLAKRAGKLQQSATTSPVPSVFPAICHRVSPPAWQNSFPHPVLTALRTVVLLH